MQDFRLNVFRVVAEKLSFTQAAELLYLTQPAVTFQIKALEGDLNVRLFDRSGGRVRLTPAGEVLLQYARRIGALYEEAHREIGHTLEEKRGRLKIGASTTIAQYLLPRLIPGFLREHPGIQLVVSSANTERVVHRVLEGEIEIGLVEGPPGRAEVRTRRFLEDELILVVAPGHRWAAHAEEGIAPAELQQEPLILREHGSGTRRVVETSLKRAGLNPSHLQVKLELDATEAIKLAVMEEVGVALISRWAVCRELSSGVLVEVTLRGVRMRRWLQWVYPQGPPPMGPAEAFLDCLRRQSPLLHSDLRPLCREQGSRDRAAGTREPGDGKD